MRSDDQVIESIAIDVAGAGHGKAGVIESVLGDDLEAAGASSDVAEVHGGEAARLAEHHVGRPVDVPRRPDDHVAEAIAVDVTRGGRGNAGFIVSALADDLEAAAAESDVVEVHCRKAARLAEHHVGRPGTEATLIVAAGPDDQIVVAVAIDVARRGHRFRVSGGQIAHILANDLKAVAALKGAQIKPDGDHDDIAFHQQRCQALFIAGHHPKNRSLRKSVTRLWLAM